MEIYANSRPQDGRNSNEDAFLIGRGAIPYAALCDGSGAAGQVAKTALKIFESQIGHASVDEIERFPTWANWTHQLDAALLGGAQSTFLAVASLKDRIVGVCAGDSRLYHLPMEGEIQILTDAASKFRLGEWEGRSLRHPPLDPKRRHPAPPVRWSLDSAQPLHREAALGKGFFRSLFGVPRSVA